MTLDEIKRLIEFIRSQDLAEFEFELEQDGFKLRVKSGAASPAPVHVMQALPVVAHPLGTAPLTPGGLGTAAVAPGAPGTAPGAPGTAPGAPGTAPGAPGTAPLTPGGFGTAPVAPGAPGTAPGAPGTAPGAPGTAPGAPLAPGAPVAPEEDGPELAIVKSPIVGTFYRAAEPGAKAFVDVGATVQKGEVLCIIEAMKLMNEIDSEYDGEIVSIYVENGQPVQYGERLFAIRLRT